MNDEIALPQGAQLVDGVFQQNLRPEKINDKRPALFLDRDGCVVVEAHYLHKVEDVQLIDGVCDVIAKANALDVAVVFVTNQAGIGYGYFGWLDFIAVQDKILSRLAEKDAHVDGVFACPFHAKGKPPYDHPDHPFRKPNPGMLLAAAKGLNLNLPSSWIVGDRAGDVEAGLNAGLAGGVQVATGHGKNEGERENSLALASSKFEVLTANSIAEVSGLIGLLS
jgi:D-glycero-D-manno-heptose 1,7-bisphosphate phosphatase